MKWIAISGSWRKTDKQVEKDVRNTVQQILSDGNGIATGGALGVDYYATDEAMKINPTLEKLKIFLPTSLKIYSAHYRKRAKEAVITTKQADDLISQLNTIKKIKPSAIIENIVSNKVNNLTYSQRISEIINISEELYAFQVNKSSGTQETINKAKQKGIQVKLFSYIVR